MILRRDELRRSLLAESRLSGFGGLAIAMAVVVVLAAALVAMLLWENANQRSRALADARLTVYHEARIIGESAARMVEATSFALTRLSHDIAPALAYRTLGAEVVGRLLAANRSWFPPISTIGVHDEAGRRIAVAGPSSVDLDDVAGLSFFADHREGAVTYLITADDTRAQLRLSRRVTSPDGRFLGVVSVVLDPLAFDIERDFDAARRIDGAAIALRSGRVLASWPTTIATSPTAAPDLQWRPLYAGLTGADLAATGIAVTENDAAIIGLSPVRNAPVLAAVTVAKERVLARWHSRNWQVFAAVIAIAAAIGLVGLGLGHHQARRKAEIERTLRVLSHALEDSPIMVLIASPDGRIEYVNRRLERVSGYGRDELVGRMPAAFVADGLRPAARQRIVDAILDGREWSGLVANRRKDGEPYWASLSISPIRDAKGRIANYVAVAEDVTDRVEGERQRRQVEKAEALGGLAGGVAHELNNLLTPILGMTGELIRQVPEGSPSWRMLDIALQAAKRARDLVKRILVFSGNSPDRRRIHDVSKLLADCLAAAASVIPADIEVKASIPDGIGRVRADAGQIEAAIANLVANAVQAMEDGGTGRLLRVTLERVEAGNRAAGVPPGLRLGPHAVIRVIDAGCGIAPDIRTRIFDPFFTTREVGEGVGLGLAIVHGVATGHGGTVTVDSAVGAGTTVSLFLPLAAAAETPDSRDDEAAAA